MGAARDHYAVLGVSRHASEAEIKRAYRALALQCHPDRHPDDPAMAARFREVSTAFEVLSNPDSRQRYDRGDVEGLIGAAAAREICHRRVHQTLFDHLRHHRPAGKTADA